MKTKIGVLGCCYSRDAFNSQIVHNYKDFFKIEISAQRTSMISIMQDSILFDEKSIEILPINPTNQTSTYFIYYDFNKLFLKELVEKKIDYLIIDNYFEVVFGILYFNEQIITNNTWDLPKTKFYKEIVDKHVFNIKKYPDEYFCIWSKYCDLFFKFLKIYCPNVKIILNKARPTDKVLKSDNTTYIYSDYTQYKKIFNALLDKLDDYIVENFDVITIEFDHEHTYLDENHIWGFAPVHYHNSFYYSLIEKLKNIISEDVHNKKFNKVNNFVFDEKNFKKELKRANIETKLLLNHIKKHTILENLKFYNIGRVDIKNFGSRDNKVKVIESNIPISEINFPNWFKSDKGEGFTIQSYESPIDLKFKCLNDGILNIYFRGPDIRDKNNKRFPVFVDLVNFSVNGKLILDENVLVWHDKPYTFKKNVKNSEIINIHVEWLSFNSSSIIR